MDAAECSDGDFPHSLVGNEGYAIFSLFSKTVLTKRNKLLCSISCLAELLPLFSQFLPQASCLVDSLESSGGSLCVICFSSDHQLVCIFVSPELDKKANLLKCEYCGKYAPATQFRGSKRFCSMTCAKR